MNRYGFGRLLGGAFLVLGVAALALVDGPDAAFVAQAALFVAGGVLFVLAGTPTRLRAAVGPHRLMGAGDVVLGASIAVSALTSTGDDPVFAAAALLGGASLAVVGLGYAFRPEDYGLGPDGLPRE